LTRFEMRPADRSADRPSIAFQLLYSFYFRRSKKLRKPAV